MNRQIILAIDFDGTIVNHEFPSIGTLKPKAKDRINDLYELGYYIIIWTCRDDKEKDEAYSFLKQNKINFHKINENADFIINSFNPYPKIFADIYIDDRNLGGIPKDWDEIYDIIINTQK